MLQMHLYFCHRTFSIDFDRQFDVRTCLRVNVVGDACASECNDPEIPANWTSIPGGYFKGCNGIRRVTIPNSVIQIGAEVFQDCRNIQTTAANSHGIEQIGAYAFRNCYKLESVELTSIAYIFEYAFYCCRSLSRVVFGENLLFVSFVAFYGTGMTSMTIPKNV